MWPPLNYYLLPCQRAASVRTKMMIQKTPCIIFGRCWFGAWKQPSTTSSQRWTIWARIGPLAHGGPRWQDILSVQQGIEDSSMPSKLMVNTWPMNSISMVPAWSKCAGIVLQTSQATPTMISGPKLFGGTQLWTTMAHHQLTIWCLKCQLCLA